MISVVDFRRSYPLLACMVLLCGACRADKAPPSEPQSAPIASKEKVASGTSAQTVTITQGDVKRTVTLKTEPIVDGCSMEGAMKTLATRHDYVRVCARNYAQKYGKAPAGRIVVSMRLKKNGDVLQSAVTDDPVGDEELNACLKEAINVRFPNPFGKNCIVQAPFQFTGKPVKSAPPESQ